MDESTIPRQPEPVIRPDLVMLIGLQGAGKTTFAGQRFRDTHVLISKDRLRNNRRPERRQQRKL